MLFLPLNLWPARALIFSLRPSDFFCRCHSVLLTLLTCLPAPLCLGCAFCRSQEDLTVAFLLAFIRLGLRSGSQNCGDVPDAAGAEIHSDVIHHGILPFVCDGLRSCWKLVMEAQEFVAHWNSPLHFLWRKQAVDKLLWLSSGPLTPRSPCCSEQLHLISWHALLAFLNTFLSYEVAFSSGFPLILGSLKKRQKSEFSTY